MNLGKLVGERGTARHCRRRAPAFLPLLVAAGEDGLAQLTGLGLVLVFADQASAAQRRVPTRRLPGEGDIKEDKEILRRRRRY